MCALQLVTAPPTKKSLQWASAFAKAVHTLFIFALQIANKHLALLVSISVEIGFKAALLVAAKPYRQLRLRRT